MADIQEIKTHDEYWKHQHSHAKKWEGEFLNFEKKSGSICSIFTLQLKMSKFSYSMCVCVYVCPVGIQFLTCSPAQDGLNFTL